MTSISTHHENHTDSNSTKSDTSQNDKTQNQQSTSIAVIGIGCRYPGAQDPKQLWSNILSRRREFRRFPDKRLPVTEYYDPDRSIPDKIYTSRAAYIDGFDFDWASRRIPQKTFLGTDIVQWLALDVADAAIRDAGYTKESVPKDRTCVVVGNTLTGEHSRANSMRLRWPFVRRALSAAARSNNLDSQAELKLVETMEPIYKSVFPEVDEDTLQGGLPNTIAGRVSNYFDLHGGGYNVDGACSSSLLAVCTAANHLSSGDADIVIAGGVDVSLDTFELIGFAKTGALTSGDMNVYDKRGAGFLPGEGCGFVVLKRLEDAQSDGDTIYSVIKGWGVSSDGKGGITAPSSAGQSMAIRRAYEKAGYSPHELDFIEGHGTGTTVGDRTELEGIAQAMQAYGKTIPRSCGVTSFKSIVGHTKAAAGIGAFIKAAIATNRRVVPPTAGCAQPNKVFEESAQCLYPILQGEVRGASDILKAGVSAMGFGGINSHVTLESYGIPLDKVEPPVDEQALLVHRQSNELFVIAAASLTELRNQLKALAKTAEELSLSDLTDLAANLSKSSSLKSQYRAAIVAGSPNDLAERLLQAEIMLGENSLNEGQPVNDAQQNIWLGSNVGKARIGYLLPGQGSQQLAMARVLVERFQWARDLVEKADAIAMKEIGVRVSEYIYRPIDRSIDEKQKKNWLKDLSNTRYAQPAICLASVLYIRYLSKMGIEASAVAGHSLGELTAFYLAGAFNEETLLRVAVLRGWLMDAANKNSHNGAMASLSTTKDSVEQLINQVDGYVVIANINSPRQIVITGDKKAVEKVIVLAEQQGVVTQLLPVSGAFHSKHMEVAASQFKSNVNINERLKQLSISLVSSMHGKQVAPGIDIAEHFSSQIVSQVNFVDALDEMQKQCDVLIEVGPGRVLSGLVEQNLENKRGVKCSPVESKTNIDRDLNLVLARVFIHGVDIDWSPLYENRMIRKFVPASERLFIESPCEKPFTDLEQISHLNYSNRKTIKGLLGTQLLENNEIEEHVLNDYISQRGDFISEIIKADLRTLGKANEELSNQIEPYHENHVYKHDESDKSRLLVSETGDTYIEEINNVTCVRGLLKELVSDRTGFPADSILLESRLLDDLNLDSIKAGELIASAAQQFELAGKIDPSEYANASLEEIASVLEEFTSEVVGITNNTELVKKGASETTEEIEDLIKQLVADRTGYPADSISSESRLLDDLNLDSIKSGELIASASQQAGTMHAELDPASLANATIKEISLAIYETSFDQSSSDEDEAVNNESGDISINKKNSQNIILDSKNSDWVRNYTVDYIESSFQEDQINGSWTNSKVIIAASSTKYSHVLSLCKKLTSLGAEVKLIDYKAVINKDLDTGIKASHVIGFLEKSQVCVEMEDDYLKQVVQRLHSIVKLATKTQSKNVSFVQFGGGCFGTGSDVKEVEFCCATGFARTLTLEKPHLKVRVLDLSTSLGNDSISSFISREVSNQATFLAVGLDAQNKRLIPQAKLQQPCSYQKREYEWSSDDVIMITGGAKGITAECSLALSRETGAKLALIGSSELPEDNIAHSDNEIIRTLQRFSDENLNCRYYCCDISDTQEVFKLIESIKHDLGPVTGVVHGAGLNKPRPVDQVDIEQALAEIQPKLKGVRNIIKALEAEPPKLFIGFSSIIGVTGMPGNAWYAFSNEAMAQELRLFENKHSETSVLSIGYSVWAEAGMGHRLGVIDNLSKSGVGAISTIEGVNRFIELFENDSGNNFVIVTSTLAGLSTWNDLIIKPDIPYGARFIENVIRIEPGVELVVRAKLNLDRDIYLKDHKFKGSYLLPTVFGLEAMAQATVYLSGNTVDSIEAIQNVRLELPITAHPTNGVEIEIRAHALEALVDGSQIIRVGISTEQTGFSSDHFSAEFVIGKSGVGDYIDLIQEEQPLLIEAKSDLYGGLLFQGELFQKMGQIYELNNKNILFKTDQNNTYEKGMNGYSKDNDDQLIFSDPFFRDVLLQSAQLVTTPDIVLPIGIGKIELYSHSTSSSVRNVSTTLTSKENRDYLFDVIATDEHGIIVEKMLDYKVRILETDKLSNTAESLTTIASRDEVHVNETLRSAYAELDVDKVPALTLSYMPELHKLMKQDRHIREIKLIERTARKALGLDQLEEGDLDISWDNNGKPCVSTHRYKNLDVSLSHDDRYCLCVVGNYPQGCDMEPIKTRSRENWIALLSNSRKLMIDNLTLGGDSIDIAGTRIWTAVEAAIKATGFSGVKLVIESRDAENVMFQARADNSTFSILTFPVELSKKRNVMISLIVENIEQVIGRRNDSNEYA